MIKIKMKEFITLLSTPPAKKMYNSHGEWCTLREIVETEKERGNSTFDDISDDFITKYNDNLVIWACVNKMNAVRYAIRASDYDLTDDELKEKYPNLEHMVECIYTEDLYVITEDYEDGYLLIKF